MKDKEYYELLSKVLDEACRNMAKGFGDVGALNDACIETRKRKDSLKIKG